MAAEDLPLSSEAAGDRPEEATPELEPSQIKRIPGQEVLGFMIQNAGRDPVVAIRSLNEGEQYDSEY